MTLTQLLYFKTVVEAGTISRAAKMLYVSAPALSISIGNLEKELGVELFEHTCNRVKLTECGKLYYLRISKVLDDLDQAAAEVSWRRTNVSGGGYRWFASS